MRRRLAFFLFAAGLLGGYTGLKAGLAFPASPWTAFAGGLVFVGLIIGWQFSYRRAEQGPSALAWAATVGMGLWASFLFYSVFLDLSGLLVAWPAWAPKAAMALSALTSALGFWDVSRGPHVLEVEVPVTGLAEELRGLRIVQVSDLHVGPTIRRSYVQKVVDRVEGLKPDLIAVTGDLADGTVDGLREPMEPLSGLKARLGTYFVTGNHEYYWNAPAWLRRVAEFGWTPLVNEGVRRGGVWVAGVTDTQGGMFIEGHAPDAAKAAWGSAEGELRVLLAHRPDACFEGEKAGFQLQLSGHTHGGQFFPWSLVIPFFHKYYKGLNRHGRLWVYVNSGTGYWGPPHRFAVPSEITALTLVPAGLNPAS